MGNYLSVSKNEKIEVSNQVEQDGVIICHVENDAVKITDNCNDKLNQNAEEDKTEETSSNEKCENVNNISSSSTGYELNDCIYKKKNIKKNKKKK